MERLLVTGIDRPVGIDLALVLAEHCDVLGVYRDQVIETSDLRTACWNAAGGASLAELTRDWRPQWILHCGPLATANWDPVPTADDAAREVEAIAQLTALAAAQSARLTVLSSDAVFAGPRMFHDESSEVTATSRWAATVRALEQQLTVRDTLVVRTHAYGWSPVSERAGFAERIWRGLSAGALAGVDGRRHATPILATDLAELLWRAHEVRLSGLCHLAGAERTSPYHFAYVLAAASNLNLPAGLGGAGHRDRRPTAPARDLALQPPGTTGDGAGDALAATGPGTICGPAAQWLARPLHGGRPRGEAGGRGGVSTRTHARSGVSPTATATAPAVADRPAYRPRALRR